MQDVLSTWFLALSNEAQHLDNTFCDILLVNNASQDYVEGENIALFSGFLYTIQDQTLYRVTVRERQVEHG